MQLLVELLSLLLQLFLQLARFPLPPRARLPQLGLGLGLGLG